MRMARCRSATLCSLLPVKYCMAAPKLSCSSARTSTCSPSRPNFTLVLLAPRPSTSCTFGCAATRSSAAAALGPVTRRSRSPMVSFPRRRLPAGVIGFDALADPQGTPSIRARCCRRSSAETARCAPCIARCCAALSLRASRPCAAACAVSAPGTAVPARPWSRCWKCSNSSAMLFGPSPWIFRNSSAAGGNFCSSSSRLSKLPCASTCCSTAARPLPMPGTSVILRSGSARMSEMRSG